LGNHVLRRHTEALRGKRVYLVPDRDDGGRTLWREARRLFGAGMKMVTMPEGIKDMGQLVHEPPRVREVSGRLVIDAR